MYMCTVTMYFCGHNDPNWERQSCAKFHMLQGCSDEFNQHKLVFGRCEQCVEDEEKRAEMTRQMGQLDSGGQWGVR